VFVPAVAIISTYFTTKIALAIGFAASGSGIGRHIFLIALFCFRTKEAKSDFSQGGVVYPIVFNRLQPQIGFAWTTRVIGFLEIGTLLIPLAVMRVRVLPATVRKLIDWSALRDAPYCTYVIGTLIGYMGLCE
jgi:hypothetical protein